jgi:lysophospholipase L1-like esterase
MRLARRTLAAALTALVALSASACTGPRPLPATSTTPPVARATGTPTPSPTEVRPVRSIAALGDSLSRGFDACSHYGDCLAASWVTGTNETVRSLATRYAAQQDGERPEVHNDARSGATVADLDRQVSLAVAQRPELVTLLIGANDVCRASLEAMTSTADYGAAVDGALQRLSAALPEATILVASVPDIPNLLPVAAGNETARFLWRAVGGCQTALADPLSKAEPDLARREAVRERLDEYNAALEGACARVARCVWDGGAVHAYSPTIAQLSPLDYFHPSVAGLRELAATEWRVLEAARRGGVDNG